MRFVASPELAAKLDSVSDSARGNLSSFLRIAASVDDKDALLDESAHALALGEDIFVYRQQRTRIYFTFGSDEDGEYLLLLDITTEGLRGTRGELFTMKNPRTNSAVNPRINSAINPRSTRRSTRGSTRRSTRGSTRRSTRGSTRRSTRGSTRRSIRGSTRRSIRGSTRRSIRGSTRRSIRGSTRRLAARICIPIDLRTSVT